MADANLICSIDGCNRVVNYGGLCAMHVGRLERHGDPLAVTRRAPPERPQRFCDIPGCGKIHKGHGYCCTHLDRFKKFGDPNFTTRTKKGEAIAFIANVASLANETDCILWPYSLDTHGYGQIQINGKRVLAHRYSLSLVCSPLLSSYWCLHDCDTPQCVNPHHLYWGTHGDNATDMVIRNRSASGERCPLSTLTEVQVREIFRIRKDTSLTMQEIAEVFSVDDSTIGSILSGNSWRRIYDELGGESTKKKLRRGMKLTPDVISEILRRRESGEPRRLIISAVGVSETTYARAVRGFRPTSVPIPEESHGSPPTLPG